MFTLYFIGGILVLVATIYGLIKLANRLETKYDYSMFDGLNLIILCATAIITMLIVAICIGHEAPQYQGGIFDGPKNMEMLFFVNVAVLVFVFIRNWFKSSLLCSLIITPIQVMAATVLLLTLFIVLQMVENLGRKLFGSVRR
jgi:isoprenylcysteine carboxyl methyltransferase (ICMT) family protein YpbQ